MIASEAREICQGDALRGFPSGIQKTFGFIQLACFYGFPDLGVWIGLGDRSDDRSGGRRDGSGLGRWRRFSCGRDRAQRRGRWKVCGRCSCRGRRCRLRSDRRRGLRRWRCSRDRLWRRRRRGHRRRDRGGRNSDRRGFGSHRLGRWRCGSGRGGSRGLCCCRRRDIAGPPVAIRCSACFGIVGLSLPEVSLLRLGAGFQGLAPVGPRMNGAHQEDDACRKGEDARHKNPGRAVRPGREDRAEIATVEPGEITATAAERCANDKLENPHQHHATPERPTHDTLATTQRPCGSSPAAQTPHPMAMAIQP